MDGQKKRGWTCCELCAFNKGTYGARICAGAEKLGYEPCTVYTYLQYVSMFEPKIMNKALEKAKAITEGKPMKETGYKELVHRIMERTIEPPEGETVHSLCAWIDGYSRCQLDILNLIEQMSKEQNR